MNIINKNAVRVYWEGDGKIQESIFLIDINSYMNVDENQSFTIGDAYGPLYHCHNIKRLESCEVQFQIADNGSIESMKTI